MWERIKTLMKREREKEFKCEAGENKMEVLIIFVFMLLYFVCVASLLCHIFYFSEFKLLATLSEANTFFSCAHIYDDMYGSDKNDG